MRPTLNCVPPFHAPTASLLLLLAALPSRDRQPIVLSLSDGTLVGVDRATTRTAAGDMTLVTGFKDKGQWISFNVDSPGGIYRARIKYRAPDGKGFVLKVAGLSYTGFFPASESVTTHDAGLIELPAGTAEIQLGGGWGHYDIAGLELLPAEASPPPPKPSPVLVNAKATPEARALFSRLLAGYGEYAWAGVHEFDDIAYVREKSGHDVALLSRDLIEYTPSRVEHGSKPDGMTERVIEEAKAGRVITLCWHWNAPKDLIDKIETAPDGAKEDKSWYLGFYSKATNFNYAKALEDENGEDYKLLLRDIDAIAVELKKLQAANVPVLWRPLHEAEGGWFWWGTQGGANYVKLWRLLYDRLTYHHGLNNLIWVYTSGGKTDWYPGDDRVDIVSVDAYPEDNRDPLVGIWNTIRQSFGDRKLIALSEVGCVPDIERMRRHGVYWSYFATWNGQVGPRGMKDSDLKERLASPHIRSRAAQ